MAPSPIQLLATLFSLSIILNFPAPATPQGQECPYPCYPPPTGTGTNPQTPPSTTLTPPSSQTGSSSYYPPPAAYLNPPPSGYLPYSPPSFGVAPPPPDQIVPWFPYYSRKPPNQSVDQSSSNGVRGSTVVIVVTHFLCFVIFPYVL